MAQDIYLIANGDLRLSANQVCWPAQQETERQLTAAVEKLGRKVVRAHQIDATKQHGFIDSQKRGLEVFQAIPAKAPLIVCEAVWQYSQHVLPGLMSHEGPILTVANWSGQWPGLVGMLNLNGSLTKAGVSYSTIWSESFDDAYFLDKLGDWLDEGHIKHSGDSRQGRQRRDGAAQVVAAGEGRGQDAAQGEGHPRRLRRGLHGDVQRHHPDELLAKAGVFRSG